MTIVQVGSLVRLPEPTVVCLGFFDGVHIGHAQLIERAVAIGKENRLKVCAHTFARMPARVLTPQVEVQELTPLPRKAALMGALGVDIVAVSDFAQTMNMRAQDFFAEILVTKLRAQYIVCGFHHRFGHRGEGDVALLTRLCAAAGIGLEVIAPVTLEDGELVSSTSIREALRAGDMARAERMLGRPSV